MPACDSNPVEPEIGETRVNGARRVMRGEASKKPRVLDDCGVPYRDEGYSFIYVLD